VWSFWTTLDEEAGEAAAIGFVLRAREIVREAGERLVEEADERAEGAFVAAVGRGGDEDQVAERILGEADEELVALVAGTAGVGIARAGVGLVHDHELGAGAEKLRPVPLALDEVDRDDGVIVELEDRLVRGTLALESRDGACQDELGVDVKLARQLPLPLLGQVGGAEDRETAGLPAGQEFGGDQAGLHRFPDTDVVGDEHADPRLFEGHE
jgi:Arc/MetJ family transcription regulator